MLKCVKLPGSLCRLSLLLKTAFNQSFQKFNTLQCWSLWRGNLKATRLMHSALHTHNDAHRKHIHAKQPRDTEPGTGPTQTEQHRESGPETHRVTGQQDIGGKGGGANREQVKTLRQSLGRWKRENTRIHDGNLRQTHGEQLTELHRNKDRTTKN